MKNTKLFELHSPVEMAKIAEQLGVYKVNKDKKICFLLSIKAGVFISIAFAFYITVTTGITSASSLAKLSGGICFALGLILVVVCGADLFTSTVLTVMVRASRLITWSQLLIHWALVYLGNFIGAIFFVFLIWFSGQIMNSNCLWGLNVLQVAEHKMNHTFVEAVCLGILCNLMVCLAVWLSYAGRSLTDKIVAIVMPVGMFVASGFEHSIANMFIIPLAIVIRNFAPQNFWDSISRSPDHYSMLTLYNFVTDNLIPVSIGNIIGGGVLVGVANWFIYLRISNQE